MDWCKRVNPCYFRFTPEDGGDSTNIAAIVGGSLGVFFALVVIILLVYFFGIRNRKSKLLYMFLNVVYRNIHVAFF